MLNSELNLNPAPIEPARPVIRHPRFLIAMVVTVIAGYFALAAAFHVGPFQAKETPLLSPTPRPSTDTSTWQTYHNDQYGFEFKYPNYLEQSNNDSPAISFQKHKAIESDFTLYMQPYSLETVTQNIENNLGQPKNTLDVVIDSKIAKKLIYDNHHQVLIPSAKGTIDILFNLPSGNQTFDQILSTFKFTSPTSHIDASTWQKYYGDPLILQYPPDWQVQKFGYLTEIKPVTSQRGLLNIYLNKDKDITTEEKYRIELSKIGGSSVKLTERKNIIINGNTWLQLTFSNGGIDNLIYKNGTTFTAEYSKIPATPLQMTAEQIFKTIRFNR